MKSDIYLKPSWEIVQFNEGLENIPNPKEKSYGHYYYEGINTIIYEMVMGSCLVYRCFAIDNFTEEPFSLKSIKEQCRYVFSQDKVFQEDSKCTRRLISVEDIDLEGTHDTIDDANSIFKTSLYNDFVRKAKIFNKKDILYALSRIKKRDGWKKCSRFSLESFIKIYKKVFDKSEIFPDTPGRIIKELHNRKHEPYKAIKIEKDLVVVTGELENKFLDCSDETRAYFDKNNVYYFERNAITGKWKSEDFWKRVGPYKNIIYRVVDKDIFVNTCVDKYIKYSLDKNFPNGNKINLCLLMAERKYLCVEQAAKIDSPVLEPILDSVYSGKIHDTDKKLSEVLGISGAQIKLLDSIDIPVDIEQFAMCVNDEEFISVYPDIKKRLYAASFYVNSRDMWNRDEGIIKEDILKASGTMNALERMKKENRFHFEHEYSDYIVMLKRYQRYIRQMEGRSPLREELLKYGDFPLNIKPSRIRDCHNRLWRVVRIIGCEKSIEKYSRLIEERYEKESRKLEYSNGTYSIVMPKNALDIISEGRELQHCVGQAGYIGTMAKKKTTILFLRENKNIDKPLLTIEVQGRRLRQCYGLRDSFNHNIKIRDFINDYASKHKIEIDAVIYSKG